jgi:hypothetical protein
LCKGNAVLGTVPPLCIKHGAAAPQVRAKAAERVSVDKARRALAVLGIPVDRNHPDADPFEALLSSLREAAGNVELLRCEVEKLDAAGLVEDGRPTAMVKLYGEWCDRKATVAKQCLDARIDERRVAVAETLGRTVATVMLALIDDPKWNLSAELREAGRVLAPQHLRALGAGRPAVTVGEGT